MLVRRTLADGPRTLCGNHAQLLGKRSLPLAELAAEAFAAGDRRRGERRRADRRGPFERRATFDVERLLEDDRRASGRRAADRELELELSEPRAGAA